MRKLVGKTNWFNQRKEGDEGDAGAGTGAKRRRLGGPKDRQVKERIESVIFVPVTVNRTLKRMLQEREGGIKGFGKVKYVEGGGSTISSILVKKDPWSSHCGRPECFPCNSGQTGKCMAQGINYQVRCETCKGEQKEALYQGESARTALGRGSEHLGALRRWEVGLSWWST